MDFLGLSNFRVEGVFSKIWKVNGYFLFKKGVGVSSANFAKYLGTFLLFHLRRGWVGGKIGIFKKSAYVPSKKYLHPPPDMC